MRSVRWVGIAVLAAAVAAGCGISTNGEMTALGDDASSGSSSGSSGSNGSSSGGTSASGSSSGSVADAHGDVKGGGDASSGGGDSGSSSGSDATTNDGPSQDAPAEAPPPDAPECVTSADCMPGYACQPNGTCDTICSSTILCNLGCCDNTTNGRCWQTGNISCNSGQLCTTCNCQMPTDCPQYWACGMNGACTEKCDPMHLCNGGCCSDIAMGTCVGIDCSSSPEGPVCNNKGFCGCNTNSDCSNAGYGPDCKGMPGGAGNGCQCTENGMSGFGDCTGACLMCTGMPTRCHC